MILYMIHGRISRILLHNSAANWAIGAPDPRSLLSPPNICHDNVGQYANV
jgi:hypothetical protein